MSENSFCQLIIDAAESHLDKVAMQIIGVEGTEYTYAEMLDAIRSIAFRLEKEGIAFGDRVALIGENHPRWAIAYFGILFRGAVCVPIDPHGEIETIRIFFDNSEAKMAFIGEDFIESFQKIEKLIDREIPAVVLQNIESNNGFQKFDDWAKTPRPEDFDQKETPAKPEDLAVLMYTSGTTGTPKGVPLTHGNIYYETQGCQEVMHISETEVVLSVLPLFHVFAQVVNLWVVASAGGKICYVKELVPAELERAFKTKEITLLTGVPRIWYLFHKKIFDGVAAQSKAVQTLFKVMLKTNYFLRDKFNINLGKKMFAKVHDGFGGKLDITISAGSRFDEQVAKDYYALGYSMIQGYGLTETTGAVSCTRFDDNVVGSVGKAVHYAETKLGEPNDDGAGEVLIKGKMVFGGYYKNPEATRETFTEDGWFKSGDLGKLDAQGNLHIVGRSKDVIVLPNGKNIHPEDLEVLYSKTPYVEELAIIGVEDKSVGKAGAEKLVAVVVPDFEYLKREKIANSQVVVKFTLDDIGRELPEYQRVREYIVRAEPLPRTATRKIKRFILKKEVESGAISDGQPNEEKSWKLSDEDKKLLDSNAGKAVVEVIKQNVKDVEIVHPSMNLEIDLGLDSLSRAEVFAALEQAISTEFEGEQAAQALTVSDIIKLVESKIVSSESNGEILDTKLSWSKIVRQTDEELPEIQAVLDKKPFFSTFAFIVFKGVNLFWKLFTRLEVRGKENLDALAQLHEKPSADEVQNSFLICPNHQSFLDPFILTSVYSHDVFTNIFHVGASEFFENGAMKFVAKMVNIVPINPDTQLVKAMKASAIGLRNGKILNIYAEGERAFDGELHEFKKGAAILATELDLPILPVALEGVHKVWARNSLKIRPAKVKIMFGKPFYAKDIIDAKTDDEAKYEAVTNHLKNEIAAMLEDLRK
jgi:long-chain acyl-CoA synthetase